jgi:hypothetical protein
MKYLCLAYGDERKIDALTQPELDAILTRCRAYDEELRKTGALVVHASLQPTRSTTCVRPRNGRVSITDGPFLEAKEQVGGFFIIEARDLNEAILVAQKHPAAHLGEQLGWGIEVRPIEGAWPITDGCARGERR